MKYRVRVEKVLVFEEGDMLELPSQDPREYGSEIGTLLEQGKRCILKYTEVAVLEENFSPAGLRAGDVVFGFDDGGASCLEGEVVSVEKVDE